MVSCAIVGCKHKQGKHIGVRFFSVPAVITNQCAKTLDLSRRRRAEWIARINRMEITENTVRKHHKVCGKHFLQGHPSILFDPSNPDWTPSLDLGYENTYNNESKGLAMEEDPLSFTPQTFKYNAEEHLVDNDYVNEPEGSAVDSKDWKVDFSPMICEETRVMNVGVQTCPTVIYLSIQNYQDMTDSSVQACPSVRDTSAQTHSSCDEHNTLKMERDVLIQNILSLNDRLSESVLKAESFEKCLIQTNESLAEKNLKIKELEAKIKQMESSSSSMDHCELMKITLSESNFRTDDKKVSFYTGLPSFSQLMLVFNLVSENIRDSTRYTLTKFQQFLMLIMWLRLGLEEQDLAYRFGVSQASVSRNLYRWLIPTSSSLEKFIVWPHRETLLASMPVCFQQNWKNAAAVIIECFQVYVGRPLFLRAGVGSQDKHQNTVKFLIGITPRGTISFISKSFDGHTSDEYITKNSGLLNILFPGDIVISDCGCYITNADGIMGARLAVPDSTKGLLQLSFDDSELAKEIANVRVHVKKVIGLVRRRYKILSGILSVDLLTKKPGEELIPIDYVVRVCCALTNVCLSVDPPEQWAMYMGNEFVHCTTTCT